MEKQSYSICETYLKKLADKFKDNIDLIKNEAQTRFHIIDEIILKCLNWPKESMQVEEYQPGNGFTDYSLGNPRKFIWEIKKEGITFEIPLGIIKNNTTDIPSLCKASKELKLAIEQAQRYCSARGVPNTIVSNGHQFVIFIASNQSGIAPLEGDAIVFESLADIATNFLKFWNCLSFDASSKNFIKNSLDKTMSQSAIPLKMSNYLINYPKRRYSSELQQTLSHLSEIIIQDIVEDPKLEKGFYEECYCESGALSKYALLSKDLLAARYHSLFAEKTDDPIVTSVKLSKSETSVDPSIFMEAVSKRPIVLIGDVGVGKTSFIKHLTYSSAYQEFQNAIYLYLDLGHKATLTKELYAIILHEMEKQLEEKYGIDIYDKKLIRGIYSNDIIKFKKGIWGDIKETNPEKYNEKLLEMLEQKTVLKDQFLKDAIQHVSKERKKQIIVCIDNTDQRDFDTQQEAFIISQELAQTWSLFVFISVRPQTFLRSKTSGALTAYPHKIFTISPPRIDNVIQKRLSYALKVSQGDLPIQNLPASISISTESLKIFIEVLIQSLKQNKELKEFLENITGGNVRQALDFVKGFIGSPNVEADKIINTFTEKGSYIIPVHEFTKQALLGNLSHFDPKSSIAMNIFDISQSDPKEHFLIPILLSFFVNKEELSDKDNFFMTIDIINEFQSLGFTPNQTESALRRTTNKKLIETSQRITFDEDDTGLIGNMPDKFRITSIGHYHLKRWIGDFAYLDAMVFDTPIFEDNLREELISKIESFDIATRYNRTCLFKTYLIDTWKKTNIKSDYFDFLSMLDTTGNTSFKKVKEVIDHHAGISTK